jgi:cell division protein FtsQ
MARNQGPSDDDSKAFYRGTRDEDERASARDGDGDSNALDERIADIDQEDDSPFLRVQKRVPVRRGALPRKTATRLKWIALGLIAITVVVCAGFALNRYGAHSWRFRLESSDSVEVTGVQHVTIEQVHKVFGGDISKNVFSIPLAERKAKLEEIPWVESAAVMRLLPNRISVAIKERVPVAYVQLGSQVALIDTNGVIMSVPTGAAGSYSFPVIIGMAESEPISTRAPRMKTYMQLISELDSCEPATPQDCLHYSKDLDEVDLSDPNDLKATVADPAGAVLIHLGDHQRAGIFLDRYKVYVTHLQEWRQQYPKLNSVDLRYDQQVVLDPASGAVQESGASPAAQKPTVTAKPKPAAAKKPQHAGKR